MTTKQKYSERIKGMVTGVVAALIGLKLGSVLAEIAVTLYGKTHE